ncbi:hypothetical protein [Rhodococcus sp. HNM0569]|uniref:hypothetical protein n=1 Tax=Rhodococcus sp. HNM0569 TaxID=2716340 RepID=UPI00146C92DF|nr:hypothetical protein [Rhodococcus sp. HNM0569]
MRATPPARERVVLAERRGARTVRTRVEVQEQTEVGDAMVRALIRTQLGLAVRCALFAIVPLCALPALFRLVPALSDVSVLGVRLPWLMLAVGTYLVLLVVGWAFLRQADRNEQEFTDLVDD